MSTYKLETEANGLFDALMDGITFTIPDIDLSGSEYEIPSGLDSALYEPVKKLTIDDLNSAFNGMMGSMATLLRKEYETGRIWSRVHQSICCSGGWYSPECYPIPAG